MNNMEENVEPPMYRNIDSASASLMSLASAHHTYSLQKNTAYCGGEDIVVDTTTGVDSGANMFLSLPPIVKNGMLEDVACGDDGVNADETFEFFSSHGLESIVEQHGDEKKKKMSGTVAAASASAPTIVKAPEEEKDELLDYDFNYASAGSCCSEEQSTPPIQDEKEGDSSQVDVVLDDPKLFVTNFFSQNK